MDEVWNKYEMLKYGGVIMDTMTTVLDRIV